MDNISFFSTCPACKHARLQNGYTRPELTAALNTDQAIDAYCLMCDALWAIGAQERLLITAQLAAGQQRAPQKPPGAATHGARPSAEDMVC
jgi:hypothetical protein